MSIFTYNIGHKFKSFTLIELLIVIVIIGILAVAIIPRLTGAQAQARDVARIGGLKQLQNALALYYVNNGEYPGATHYASVKDPSCGHLGNSSRTWTGIFDVSFQENYLPTLPIDPRGNIAEYCYGYTRHDNTATYCIKKDGTIIDIDGIDASDNITGPQGEYVITFRAETDLRDTYPRRQNKTDRYCLFSSAR